MIRKTRLQPFGAIVAAALLTVACSPGTGTSPSQAPESEAPGSEAPESQAPSQAAGGEYRIGYSNAGGVGNGFREEQVCTAKAEALASGQVTELVTIHRNTDAAGQLSDIRDLIAADVDAIVFNPNDPEALNPALEEANAAGIVTVSVDAFVTHPETYDLYNNQIRTLRGASGCRASRREGTSTTSGWPASSHTDRQTGFEIRSRVPRHRGGPEIEGVHTGWDPSTTTQLANDSSPAAIL